MTAPAACVSAKLSGSTARARRRVTIVSSNIAIVGSTLDSAAGVSCPTFCPMRYSAALLASKPQWIRAVLDCIILASAYCPGRLIPVKIRWDPGL